MSEQHSLDSVDHDALRAQARAVMDAASLTAAAAAKDAGVSYSTYHAWLSGSYAGNNDKVAAQVAKWIAARAVRTQTRSLVPVRPAFCWTATARRIVPMLQYAQALGDISVLVGGAGVGKTTALRHYQGVTPNVWLSTSSPIARTVGGTLVELAAALGIVGYKRAALARVITERMAGSGGLLIVDEAQHLDAQALEQLRSLHDTAKIGLVLCGNQTILSRVDGGRQAEFAQLFSRVGMRVVLPKASADDVKVMLDQWGVADPDQVKFCTAIAGKPGALRGLDKCLMLAGMLAAGEGRERSIDDLRAAWSQLDSTYRTGGAA